MENPSFYDVFQKMWQGVLEKLNYYTPVKDFNDHTSDNKNPHAVTAQQAGALPITGGTLEGILTAQGIVLTEDVDYGSGDPSGGVKGQLYFKKVT